MRESIRRRVRRSREQNGSGNDAPRIQFSTQGWRRSDSARYANPLAKPFFDIGNAIGQS